MDLKACKRRWLPKGGSTVVADHHVNYVNRPCYRPQQEFRKGNVFTSVCQEFCKLACRVKGGIHGEGGVHGERGVCVVGACMAGGMCCRGWVMCWGGGAGACVAEETATAGDGTHCTGMHS